MKKVLSLFVVAGLVCSFAAAQKKVIRPHYKAKPGIKVVKGVKVIKPKTVKKVVVKKTH